MTALLFPGQGSQYIGMTKDFHDEFAIARETFEKIENSVKINLRDIIFSNKSELLNITKYTQLAIYSSSMSIFNVFKNEMDIDKSMNIGFSQIFLNGKYQESYSGEDYQLNFTHLKTQLKLNIDFSDYASVKLNYNYFIKNHNYELENDSGESNRKNSSYAVAVEFVL